MSENKQYRMMAMGLPQFSIGLRHDLENERYFLDASVQPPAPFEWIGAIHLFGDEPKEIDPEHALRFLINNWRAIAGLFVEDGPEFSKVDLGGIFASTTVKTVMRSHAYHINFEQAPFLGHLGSHSVLVVECFLQLGRVLSAIVMDAQLTAEWNELMFNTTLLPFEPDEIFRDREWERELQLDPVDAPAFYATKLGLSVPDYRRWAVYAYARHLVWALDTDEDGKPKGEEPVDQFMENPHELPLLPHYGEISALAARAAELMATKTDTPKSRADIVVDAIHDRNALARQLVVYGRYYGEHGDKGIDAKFTGDYEGRFRFKLEQYSEGMHALIKSDHRRFSHSIPLDGANVANAEKSFPQVASGLVRFENGAPVSLSITDIAVDEVAMKVRKLLSRAIPANSVDDIDFVLQSLDHDE